MATLNITEVLEESGQTLAQKDMREIRRAQRNDNLIDRWRCAVIDKNIPKRFLMKEDLTMRKQFRNFTIKRGIIFRVVQEGGTEDEQLVVLESYRKEILRSLHHDVGHPGQRAMNLIRDRFYWPGLVIFGSHSRGKAVAMVETSSGDITTSQGEDLSVMAVTNSANASGNM